VVRSAVLVCTCAHAQPCIVFRHPAHINVSILWKYDIMEIAKQSIETM